MLGISTSYWTETFDDGERLLAELKEVGLPLVEVDYRVSERAFRQMEPELRRGPLKVITVHNYMPALPGTPILQGDADAFLLSSPDKEERERAIAATIRTIEIASDLEARALVLHLGTTSMPDVNEELFAKYERGELEGDEGRDYLEKLKEERDGYGGPQYDAARFTLEKLNRRAERLGVSLGLENRYSLHRFPSYDEIDALLEEFRGSMIAYWHDVGHAGVHENLGLWSQESVLERFSGRMVGVHLHDCKGVKDHLAPGMGDVDFDMVKRFLGPETLRVLEAHKSASREELLDGITLLEEKGLA